AAVVDERLGVRPLRRARGRVARVADRELAVEPAELLLVEDLRDETEVAERRQPPPVRDRDPGGLLPAVLEREQAEVREPGHVPSRRPDPEDAAHQATCPIRVSPREPSFETFSSAHAISAAPPSPSAGSSSISAGSPLHVAASSTACSSP